MGYKRWASRYFVLEKDGRGAKLRWFNSKDDYERDQKENPPLNLVGAVVEEVGDDAMKVRPADANEKPFHLKALTTEERDGWVTKLRA